MLTAVKWLKISIFFHRNRENTEVLLLPELFGVIEVIP